MINRDICVSSDVEPDTHTHTLWPIVTGHYAIVAVSMRAMVSASFVRARDLVPCSLLLAIDATTAEIGR